MNPPQTFPSKLEAAQLLPYLIIYPLAMIFIGLLHPCFHSNAHDYPFSPLDAQNPLPPSLILFQALHLFFFIPPYTGIDS
jgi:hypothetical protein